MDAAILQRFKIGEFSFRLRAQTSFVLPYFVGATLRGGFGHVFKRVVRGAGKTQCDGCLLKGKCPYSYVFETPPLLDARMMKKYPSVPHPFVIEAPLEKRFLGQNEAFEFTLVLIGRGIEYLPYFAYAFEELCRTGLGSRTGRYVLEKVIEKPCEKVLLAGTVRTIEQPQGRSWLQMVGNETSGNLCKITFQTPTRLKFDQNYLRRRLPFHVLTRNLLRRLSALAYFHCDDLWDLDYRELIERSMSIREEGSGLEWHEFSRFSTRQQKSMELGGLTGKTCYVGALGDFWPFLRLGERVHVGKACTFGFGQYTLA